MAAAILVLLLSPGLAQAGTSALCPDLTLPDASTSPSTSPMASGGQITRDVSACDAFGGVRFESGPTAHGTYSTDGDTNTLTYTNSGDGATSDTFSFHDSDGGIVQVTVSIAAPATSIVISPSSLPDSTIGSVYSQAFSASGGTAPYTFSVSSGTLPPGLSLSGATLAGAPTALGTYNFTLQAQDGAGATATKSYSIVVNPPTIAITPASLPDPVRGMSYSQTLSADSGTPPYTFTLASGALPAGLSLGSNGVISGTPTTTGPSSFRIRVEDSTPAAQSGPYFGTADYTVTTVAPPPLSLSPATLPEPQVGAFYSATVAASDGVAPYTYAVTAGALPAGLGLDASTGTITGTPTAGGAANFTITATDSNSTGATSGSQAYAFTVSAPAIVVSPTSLPGATRGTAFSQTLSASGGTAGYTYAVTAGALPAGVTLGTGGILSGTPTAWGTFNFVVTATDSSTGAGPYTGSQGYTWTVDPGTPVISPSSLPAGTIGVSYAQTLTVTGGTAPYSFNISAGALPPGLAFASNGQFSGTPTGAGSFSFTVTVTDASAQTGSQAYNLAIGAPTITVSPATLPDPVLHVAYSQNVSASGGTAPYGYAVTAGSLPAGLVLDASTGALGGTPTTPGPYSFTVSAADASTGTGAPFSDSQTYSGTVSAPNIALAPATLSAATTGVPVNQAVTASGGAAPYTYGLTAGALPPGVGLSSDGTLSGTPTAGGSFSFTIEATDSNTNTGTQAYTWMVAAATIAVSPASLPAATDGVAYAQSLTASGGTAAYAYVLSAGALPAGLSLSSAGDLTGTPTAAGNFNFTVQATDSSTGTGPYTGSRSYTLQVAAPTLTLTPASGNLTADYGQSFTRSFTAGGGVAPHSYTLSGSLPAGLSWNAASATISGTATQTGSFPVSVTATDSSTGTGAPFSVTNTYVVQVGTPSITLAPSSLAAGTVGSSYSATLAASGGLAPYNYSISSGALPAGLSLSAGGVLSGTPTAAGTFSITVTATDANGQSGNCSYSLTIAGPALNLAPGSLPAATAEAGYSQAIVASGGIAPYSYAITAGSLPAGLTLDASSGTLAGTPTVAGSFNLTVTATDSTTGTGAPFSVSQAYTLAVKPPGITLAPATLPAMQAAVPINQQLTASGGDGSYGFSVTSGALPPGLTLSATGLLSGAPTTAGSYPFTVTATDGLGFTGTQAYTVSVGQPSPVVANDTASTKANQTVAIAVTSNDTGPFSSIAMAKAPAHGKAAVDGLSVIYTPATDFYGSDSFTYTATGPGGSSAPATVTVSVAALAVPVAKAQETTVLAGKSVTIHAATGATGGPFESAAISSAPVSGKTQVTGTDIVYTAAADSSGKVTFEYTLANAFGSSKPAKVTVTVNPIPIAPGLELRAMAGTTAHVDLTKGARGGPFTGAAVLSVQPTDAGTATVRASGSGYVLDFTAAGAFSGVASLRYTLSNAFATSAPGVVRITVAARPDPSRDAEVLGILAAQADATRRMARGQIGNFQQRLESLHSGSPMSAFSNGLSFSSAGARHARAGSIWTDPAQAWNRRYLVQPDDVPAAAAGARHNRAASPGGFSFWTGGAVNFGRSRPGSSVDGIDFTTSGITFGADKRLGDALALGGGVGYGHDSSDVGRNGSRSTVDSYDLAFYGSYHPQGALYVDGLVGYQWLSLDARRYLGANGGMVKGSRDGRQWFGSLALGYEHHADDLLFAPYGRIDVAHARLDGYAEQGDAIYALAYDRQTVDSSTGSVGLRMQWSVERNYGIWMPRLRAEYQHDFQGSSSAAMHYADLLDGMVYRAGLPGQSRNHTLLGVGIQLQTLRGWMLRFEYQNLLDDSTRSNQSILLGVEKTFPP